MCNKMKNKKGFTLIELLAVIVIMGILMWGAVTAYGRIMENSKKDVFATTVAAYVEAIGNYKLANQLECKDPTTGTKVATLEESGSTYVFYIATSTAAIDGAVTNASNIVNQTLQLMEKGGKSSWGNADVYGYVTFQKNASGVTQYSVLLNDVAGNGTGDTALLSPSEVNKSHVSASATTATKLTKITADYEFFIISLLKYIHNQQ